MLHLALLRSPFAHAKITHIDVSAALGQPGVVAAFTGEDLADEWAIGIPCGWQVTEDLKMPDHWPIAKDEVNHVGDAVAVVVASDRYTAQDALEHIDVDYEPLDVVIDMEEAVRRGARRWFMRTLRPTRPSSGRWKSATWMMPSRRPTWSSSSISSSSA